jgi:hypothetical protein
LLELLDRVCWVDEDIKTVIADSLYSNTMVRDYIIGLGAMQ